MSKLPQAFSLVLIVWLERRGRWCNLLLLSYMLRRSTKFPLLLRTLLRILLFLTFRRGPLLISVITLAHLNGTAVSCHHARTDSVALRWKGKSIQSSPATPAADSKAGKKR